MDIALENGRDNRCVSDAEVNAWFTCRNMRVQWVYDWQDIVVGPRPGDHLAEPRWCTANDDAGERRAIMYPAGTWTMGTARRAQPRHGVRLGQPGRQRVHRAFMEECDLLVQRCTESSPSTSTSAPRLGCLENSTPACHVP